MDKTLLRMCNNLLLLFCAKYISITSRHVLFLPDTFSVGSEETVTITIYDDSVAQFLVEANLFYTECQCRTNSRPKCEDHQFSIDSAVARNGMKSYIIL